MRVSGSRVSVVLIWRLLALSLLRRLVDGARAVVIVGVTQALVLEVVGVVRVAIAAHGLGRRSGGRPGNAGARGVNNLADQLRGGLGELDEALPLGEDLRQDRAAPTAAPFAAPRGSAVGRSVGPT